MLRHTEYRESVAFSNWLTTMGIRHFHVPNETGGNAARGVMNRRMGVQKGVPDFFVFIQAKYSTTGKPINLAIEMKSTSGRPTKDQRAWLTFLTRQEFVSAVCHGWIDGRDLVNEYIKPKKVEFQFYVIAHCETNNLDPLEEVMNLNKTLDYCYRSCYNDNVIKKGIA